MSPDPPSLRWKLLRKSRPSVYLPRSVERDLHRYQRAEDIAHDGPFIGVSPRHVQRIVKTVAERTAERTGNDDFQKVSSHDLRRYFAHTCLVEKRMNPRVVMEIGGWDDYQSLEPYLNKPVLKLSSESSRLPTSRERDTPVSKCMVELAAPSNGWRPDGRVTNDRIYARGVSENSSK
jgi:integrase